MALQQRDECFGDRQKEDCHEIRRDLIENLERPSNAELFLRERIRHVHDIQYNQQNDEKQHVHTHDVRVEVNAWHIILNVEQIENIKYDRQKCRGFPHTVDLLMKRKRVHLQVIDRSRHEQHLITSLIRQRAHTSKQV